MHVLQYLLSLEGPRVSALLVRAIQAMKACILRPPPGHAVECCQLLLCQGAPQGLCQKGPSRQPGLLWRRPHRLARCAWLSCRAELAPAIQLYPCALLTGSLCSAKAPMATLLPSKRCYPGLY